MTIQGPITFQDVAASFTEKQWMHLEDWQKEIYKTVVKEIHEAIISLGYTIINPEIVFNVKKANESSVRVNSQSVEKNTGTRDLPDILLRVKDEHLGEAPPGTEKQQNVAQPSTSSLLNVTELDATREQMPSSSQPKKGNGFPIKIEQEAYSIDEYNSTGGDKEPSPSRDYSLIKYESEEETDTEDDFQAVIVKEEEEFGLVSDDHSQQEELLGHPRPDLSDWNDGDQQSGEDSSSETGPKRFKSGPQVRGDILSLQEREARRLRVMEGGVHISQTSPSVIIERREVKEEKNETIDYRRDIKNTNWCKCGNCCVMSTVEESICCHEISGLHSMINDERVCITKHPAFLELCLDRERLDFLYRFLARIKRKNDLLYYVHKLRRTSYRAFVIWAHGFLDFRKYKAVPACVVKRVQEVLPYPEELNVGYMKMYDYPAALMALDHI
ncbi:uncharacterized protein LOC130294562 isoform X2 [Hyla sarda]|uniref:uncharacterized protein LOC130294562 isoform X2 n=1 Tax=Hyla sarda TaxID=327740 RepID=UPI0024C3C6F4|nr:uncharacterized protein LOC130294562 isoform X2 [Hyla sarda]